MQTANKSTTACNEGASDLSMVEEKILFQTVRDVKREVSASEYHSLLATKDSQKAWSSN